MKGLSEEELFPDKAKIKELTLLNKEICNLIEKSLRKNKINAEIFVGGSFAKLTIAKSEVYEADVFLRFDWKYEEISDILEKVIKEALDKNYDYERVHGSRDYFRINARKDFVIEFIPVIKIKNPKEARNVTDLSYFHVNYVKNELRKNKNLAREIILAKLFCKAQGVYGAESYIQGFSGYALECLIIYYKSLMNMAKKLVNLKERIIIDPKKHYKKSRDVLFELNEAKLGSPIVLIDPTFKERNALASLSNETFKLFQDKLKLLIKNPRKELFTGQKFNANDLIGKAKKGKLDFTHLEIETDKQPGDIAGTKMKKFANFLIKEIERMYEIKEIKFIYNSEQKADFYILSKSKKEIIDIGPPIEMKAACVAFKKAHNNTFVRNGRLCVKISVKNNLNDYLKNWITVNRKKISEMDVSEIKIN
jgi:tRNA nucleotidyltransferase (CCA-adding enzyme)